MLTQDGTTAVRFTNTEIRDNLEGVLQHWPFILNVTPARWASPTPTLQQRYVPLLNLTERGLRSIP
jgi:hypothetical protein